MLTWYIGLITPSTQFIAMNQGIDANPTWLQSVVDGRTATGTTTIEGIEWDVYDYRTDPNPGNDSATDSDTLDAVLPPRTQAHWTLIGSGTGYFVTGGEYVPIKWSRSDISSCFTYTLEDGTALNLSRGTTYVGVIPTNGGSANFS